MVIITGVGRCGTSFLTKFLKECGYDVGSERWYDTVDAGLENKETISINERLISHFIKGQEIKLDEVKEDIKALEYDVIKDPRFLADSRIIEFWFETRQDFKVIFLTREPEEIVKSMKRVPEWSSPVYRLFPEMIKAKNKAFLATLNELEIDYSSFEFPFFLGYPRVVIHALPIKLPKDAVKIWHKLRK